MTREEFAIETKTLEEFYGKELNYTQADIWFDELKNYSADKYQEAIKRICKTSQYRPTLVQVTEELNKLRRGQESIREKVPCELCKGTGYIFHNRVENGQVYQYACLCACKNAEGLEYNGMNIADKEHRQPFYIKTAQEIFGDRLNEKRKTESNAMQRNVGNLVANLGKQMSL